MVTGESVLEIVAYGAWNGGQVVDNSIYADSGMTFKGGIPVNPQTIEERIGVRSRFAAPEDARIGVEAMQNLLDTAAIDFSRVKIVIGATNVGEDMDDPGPLVSYPYALLQSYAPHALVLDLYAGCPGFNVAVELIFVMALTGRLRTGDLAVIVGAENVHRAKPFRPADTANIIFGDDAMTTALEAKMTIAPKGRHWIDAEMASTIEGDYAGAIAEVLHRLIGSTHLDGIIIDNQLGQLIHRVPALAARVQHALVRLQYPEADEQQTFSRFKEAIDFYDNQVQSFAFDIMTMQADPALVNDIAEAYISSGRHKTVAAVFVGRDKRIAVRVHHGEGFVCTIPGKGIVDAHTRTHGCFGNYIYATQEGNRVWGNMDGKGVFLYATQGANTHLSTLLERNNLALADIELLVEHQSNFAMIPLTLEQLIDGARMDKKQAVADFVEQRMIINIHNRGNCSVVCMPRLPYDLQQGVLEPDTIQGFLVNGNVERLKTAKIILNDSVGAGMTRSAFLQRL
jgi:3-oxoacyl-[acyl-carrier-protein] synthase III